MVLKQIQTIGWDRNIMKDMRETIDGSMSGSHCASIKLLQQHSCTDELLMASSLWRVQDFILLINLSVSLLHFHRFWNKTWDYWVMKQMAKDGEMTWFLENILPLQRTRVQFPAPMLASSHMPFPPAPGTPDVSVMHRHLCSTYPHTNTYIQLNIKVKLLSGDVSMHL